MAPSLVLGCFVEASSGRAWATCLDVDTLQVLASSGIAEEDVRAPGAPPLSVADAVAAATSGCLKAGNVPPTQVLAVCIGAERGDEADVACSVAQALREHTGLAAADLLVYTEPMIMLARGTGGTLEGALVVAGPGSAVFGLHVGAAARSESSAGSEESAQALGWGPVFQDAGSGYALAVEALAAVARATDDCGEPTALAAVFAAHLGAASMHGLRDWAYKQPRSWTEIADLAPLLLVCAQQGDAVAESIMRRAVSDLLAALDAVLRKLGNPHRAAASAVAAAAAAGGPHAAAAQAAAAAARFPVVLEGQLLERGSLYARCLQSAIESFSPGIRVLYPALSAAQGAACVAQQHVLSKRREAAAAALPTGSAGAADASAGARSASLAPAAMASELSGALPQPLPAFAPWSVAGTVHRAAGGGASSAGGSAGGSG